MDKNEGGVFVRMAKKLVQQGFAVFRFDFRGHGESAGESVDMTVAGEILDLEAAIDHVHQAGYEYVGLVAASFGGSIASLFLAKNPGLVHALCLWNPVLNYIHTFVKPFLPWLAAKKNQLQSKIEDQGWTRIGSANYKIGAKLWQDFQQLKPYQSLKKLAMPTCILHGDADQHVPYIDAKKYSQVTT